MVKLDTCFLPSYYLLKRTYCTCFGINWGARTSHVRYTVYQFIILCNMFFPGQPSRAQSIWNYIEELFMMCRTVARTVFSTLQYIMYARHPGPKSTCGHNHVNSSFHQQSGWDGIPMDSKYVPPASSLRYLLMKLSYCLRLMSASYYRYNNSRLCYYWELLHHLQIYDILLIVRDLVLECIHLYTL